MRKIDQQSAEALINARPFRSSNTTVEVLPNVSVLKLHGNAIAYQYNDPERTLAITDAGWNTVTTRSRLNALPNVRVNTKKGQLFLNGEKWDGKLKDLK